MPLCIYNYPTLFDPSLEDLHAIFPIGTMFLVREPKITIADSGIVAVIYVDSPCDVQILHDEDYLVKNVTWNQPLTSLAIPTLPTTPDGWRGHGTTEFKARRWLSAAVSYTNGLRLDP